MFFNKNKIPDYINDQKDFFGIESNKNTDKVLIEKKEAKEDNNKTKNLVNRLFTVIMIIILILSFISITDIILVTRFDKNPIFAPEVKKYADGTKEYLGWGYKIINYSNSTRGEKVIGGWDLKYNITPVKTNILDLTIAYNNDFEKFIDKYFNKYLEIEGTVTKIDNGTIVISDNNLDKNYKLDIKCNSINKNVEIDMKVKMIGTLYNYNKDEILLKNCKIK